MKDGEWKKRGGGEDGWREGGSESQRHTEIESYNMKSKNVSATSKTATDSKHPNGNAKRERNPNHGFRSPRKPHVPESNGILLPINLQFKGYIIIQK